jgi:integrase/recombinase XerD
MDVRLRYLWEDTDRHGNVRVYVVMPGRKKIRIRERFGTAEFMAAYQAAIGGCEPKIESKGGTFGHLCLSYMASKRFKSLDEATRYWQRRHLERLCEKHADKPVSMLGPSHVRTLRDELDANAGNHRLKALRAVFKWAVEARLVDRNPTLGIERAKVTTEGYHTWTEDEVALFEARHPIGTQPRLAMALLLYTACRREDVIRLSPQHARHGRIVYTQAKNEHIKPVRINIPIHPDLQRIIAATKIDGLTFLTSPRHRPFETWSFTRWFAVWCKQAGIPHCTPHGLRKTAATRLAEAECTTHEIQAVTGHATLHEVERYTKAARRQTMADTAMAKLVRNTPTENPGGRKNPKSA